MKGNAEFLVLFVPFLLVGITLAYINLTNTLGWIIEGFLWLLVIFCIGVDIFALLVQFINWKYYKE